MPQQFFFPAQDSGCFSLLSQPSTAGKARAGKAYPLPLQDRRGGEVFDESVNRRNINCWRCRYLFILTRPNFVLTLSGRRRSISGMEGKSPSSKPPRYEYSGSVQRSSKNHETGTTSPSASFPGSVQDGSEAVNEFPQTAMAPGIGQ